MERSHAHSIEILDLRHFAAPVLRPVLEAEGELWEQRLHWDYRASARLLMQYLDNHMLPGYAALEAGRVTGYVFCVYEETKAVIGDVFALPLRPKAQTAASGPAHATEETLLKHLFELLLNSPHVDRIESQLLLHPSGSHSDAFRAAGFRIFRRLFLVQSLEGRWSPPQADLPGNLELRPWREADLAPAARLICEAYRGHPDSLINDQYRSVHGSMRFLNNIVRYAGCGSFAPAGVVRGGGARQPRTGSAGAGLARQRAKRAPDAGLRSPGIPAPRTGPPAARAGRVQLHAAGRHRDLTHRDRSQLRGHRTL